MAEQRVFRAANESATARLTPDAVIKVELDERAYVYPQHKQLTHLIITTSRPNRVRFEASYAFNQSRDSPVLFEINVDDCAELQRRLVEAVYRAQSAQVVTPTLSLAITVAANGYMLQLNDDRGAVELFVGLGSIWRVCNGIARAVDLLAPITSN